MSCYATGNCLVKLHIIVRLRCRRLNEKQRLGVRQKNFVLTQKLFFRVRTTVIDYVTVNHTNRPSIIA